ncbi:MAG TPA: amidohydrolase family protein [Planctomycetota bacterium]|jgi:predicted TIM-barrel fold metal-dependent hydrolase
MNRTAMGRRAFLGRAGGAAAGVLLAVGCNETDSRHSSTAPRPAHFIDTHTHFYDPSRAQGVPWPPKDIPKLYRTVLPELYRSQSVTRHADATVVVEASEWVEDNQWILDLADKNSLLIGFVGNLPVGSPEFPGLLRRFSKNKHFSGIRLRDPFLKQALSSAEFWPHLRLLAQHGLELDINLGPTMLSGVTRIAKELPDLRIVIDHIGNVRIDGKEPPDAWRRGIAEAAARGNVYCKLSSVVDGAGRKDGSTPTDVSFYEKALDVVWSSFGEERLIYGSNWPVSELYASLDVVQNLALQYVGSKGASALDRVFWKNALTFYHCKLQVE